MNAPDPNAFSLDINDPQDAELIEYFLGELPARVDAINAAASHDNFEQLGRIAHQLKGAAPGFGFPTIGSAASKLDEQIREIDATEEAIKQVRMQVESLVSLCRSFINPKP